MDFASRMAEEKIQQAITEGQFDNLPGKGKPLELEDLSGMPQDMRMSYLMMKNSGFLPEEVQVKKEIASLEEMIEYCKDPDEKERHKRKLSEKELRWKMLLEKQSLSHNRSARKYRHKLTRFFSGG